MTPQEVAMKFSSASATCKNGKCPFTAECRGTTETCKLKEVAMMIRALLEETALAHARYEVLERMSQDVLEYVRQLEKINENYYWLITQFQNGYRPKIKRKKNKVRKRKPKENLVEMDGDARYAYEEPKKNPDLPVVII